MSAKRKRNPSLRERLEERLKGPKFRYLNEDLYYSKSSKYSESAISENRDLFIDYHAGFSAQVKTWPSNPVHSIVKSIQSTLNSKKITVVDFGCGDAFIARSFEHSTKVKVHSFDFLPLNDFVVAANSSNVPLPASVADIAVFCLSLMGTDFISFLAEANRVLKPGAKLVIAEVKSRFDAQNNFPKFIKLLKSVGFDDVQTDQSNKMFVVFEAVKKSEPKAKSVDFVFKPYKYKKR